MQDALSDLLTIWPLAEDHYLEATRLFAEASLLIPLAGDQGGRSKARLNGP